MLKRVFGFLLITFFVLILGVFEGNVVSASQKPLEKPIKIVVDSYHSHNFINIPSDADMYNYHNVYGFRHLFRYLESRGATVDEITGGPLTKKTLAEADMLFINLTSMDLPPFRMSEIKAIKQYVEGGGGLLVVTDHSNCYYHAYKLTQLFDELAVDVTTETACDVAPQTLANGNGWIVIDRFKPHPVTQGVKAIAMMTGGSVDDRYGVAFTSDKAWGDQWIVHPYGEGDTPGFYGNWTLDKGERTGKLAVMLAKNYGRGRVVVVGDQNMWGDAFCNYADNYRFWLNSVAWLTGEAQIADAKIYEQWQKPRILAYEKYSQAVWGNCDEGGHFNLFVLLGRNFWTFASDNLASEADLVVFAHDKYALSDEDIKGLIKHLKAKRNILVLNPASNMSDKAQMLIHLNERLGTPVVSSDARQIAYTWEGYGSLIMFSANEEFINRAVLHPQQRPDDRQKTDLEYLLWRIKSNIH